MGPRKGPWELGEGEGNAAQVWGCSQLHVQCGWTGNVQKKKAQTHLEYCSAEKEDKITSGLKLYKHLPEYQSMRRDTEKEGPLCSVFLKQGRKGREGGRKQREREKALTIPSL